MTNLVEKTAFDLGVDTGEIINRMFEARNLTPRAKPYIYKVTELNIPDSIKVKNPQMVHFLASIGASSDVAVIGNSLTAGLGAYTASMSAISFSYTPSPHAKCCYLLGVIFSTTAVASAGTAVVARACKINEVGILAEALGFGFYKAGNRARLLAQIAEGKKPKISPFKARSLVRSRQNFSFNKIAFGAPVYIESIPYGKIVKTSVLIFSIYQYSKFIIASYRSAQRFSFKRRQQKASKLMLEQSTYLVGSFQSFIFSSRLRVFWTIYKSNTLNFLLIESY